MFVHVGLCVCVKERGAGGVDGEVEQRGIFGTGVPRRGGQEPGRMRLGVLVLVGITAQGQVPGQEDLHLHQQLSSLPGRGVRTGGWWALPRRNVINK